VLLPEGGVGDPRRAARHRAARPRRHDRHGRALPRDAADLEALRGPLRRAHRGRGRAIARRALERALGDAQAWITGIRREQAETRAHTELVEVDDKRGIAKYNPLAFWTEKDLWSRILERGLPYHPLHDHGYASIGCACCTQPGSGREGRWAGTDKTECGLHVPASPGSMGPTDGLPVV
jgi:3'-phosphoadenosine 5'-phosphosulfate sulfotransferase (PAPS reductase)/FAD synthetase